MLSLIISLCVIIEENELLGAGWRLKVSSFLLGDLYVEETVHNSLDDAFTVSPRRPW